MARFDLVEFHACIISIRERYRLHEAELQTCLKGPIIMCDSNAALTLASWPRPWRIFESSSSDSPEKSQFVSPDRVLNAPEYFAGSSSPFFLY
jgi:hypothetical protein